MTHNYTLLRSFEKTTLHRILRSAVISSPVYVRAKRLWSVFKIFVLPQACVKSRRHEFDQDRQKFEILLIIVANSLTAVYAFSCFPWLPGGGAMWLPVPLW